jgi:CDGSH-type Zn-finger protein
MTTIKVSQNGPLQIDSADATLVDWNGSPYPISKRPFYLCRCGASRLTALY